MQLWWNGRIREKIESYREGGARGEVVRGSSTEGERTATKTSIQLTTGTTERLRVCGVTAEPTVEQIWQGCEPAGPEFTSAQKWNCAARKIIPSSKAPNLILSGLRSILLL